MPLPLPLPGELVGRTGAPTSPVEPPVPVVGVEAVEVWVMVLVEGGGFDCEGVMVTMTVTRTVLGEAPVSITRVEVLVMVVAPPPPPPGGGVDEAGGEEEEDEERTPSVFPSACIHTP